MRAVDGVSIAIKDGEFFSMLGPSGSGKTTCLRLIAGFEQLSGGAISIFGKPASNTDAIYCAHVTVQPRDVVKLHCVRHKAPQRS